MTKPCKVCIKGAVIECYHFLLKMFTQKYYPHFQAIVHLFEICSTQMRIIFYHINAIYLLSFILRL